MKLQTVYGTSTALTMTLASLPTGSARACAAVDNGTNKFLDTMVTLSIPMGSGTPSGEKLINVYFYGSEDGTLFGDNASGSDQSIVKRDPTNWKGPFQLNVPDSGALTYNAVIPSVAAYFNKILPRKWGVIVENQSGVTFGAVEGNFQKTYTGVSLQFETPSVTIHNAATVAADGNAVDVQALSTLNLQITGTATSFNLAFLGSVDGTNYSPISAMNLKTFNLSTTAAVFNEIWQIDTSSLKYIMADLTAVSGGNVTVKTFAIP